MNTNIISGLINRLTAIFSLLFVGIRVHSWLKFFPGPANGHKPQSALVPEPQQGGNDVIDERRR
jgi:hypothetical protein